MYARIVGVGPFFVLDRGLGDYGKRKGSQNCAKNETAAADSAWENKGNDGGLPLAEEATNASGDFESSVDSYLGYQPLAPMIYQMNSQLLPSCINTDNKMPQRSKS